MKKWLKRIRGAVGMGLTWAVAWSPVGLIFAAVLGSLEVLAYVVFGGMFAVAGLIGGGAFSVVLGIAERRRTFDQMSLPRFAGWGALGGLLLSVLLLNSGGGAGGSALVGVVMVSLFTLMGAGSAAGSLALARRADDRELLEDGADVADIGLTEEETRELLGT